MRMQSRVMHRGGIVLAPAACVDGIEHPSHARRRDGGQKEVREEIRKSEVRARSEQDRRERNASPQEGDAEERAWRQGRQGEEPQAGDRDRSLRGTKQGREGSAKALVAKDQLAKELVTQELQKGRIAEELEEAFVVTRPRRYPDGAGAYSTLRRRRHRVRGGATPVPFR